jgi:hypothetical protein
LLEGDVAHQTERALENLKAILTHAGLSLSHVVKTTVFLKDIKDFAAMNEVYAKYFPVAAAAGSTVQADGLPKDALVEIEARSGALRASVTDKWSPWLHGDDYGWRYQVAWGPTSFPTPLI